MVRCQDDGVYRIGSVTTRRKFIATLAASGGGLAGIRKTTARTFGEKPAGVPIVWRLDRFENPETVRYIPKERYRRIMAYHKMDPETVYEKSHNVNGIALIQTSSDPTDLSLKVYVNRNTRSVRRSLPNRIQDVPVVAEERKVDRRLASCDRRIQDFYDPLPANPEIKGIDDSGNKIGAGTLGVVCWNANDFNPYEAYITAYHVVEKSDGTPARYLKHDGVDADGNVRGERIGIARDYSPSNDTGLDVIKYERRAGTVSPALTGNASDKLSSVSGAWTHSGLTDATTGTQSVTVEFAGRTTCYAQTDCVSTEKSDLLEFQATYSPNETDHGDSGGPFLDTDGFLVGTFTAFNELNETSRGPTGQELLDRTNAQLHDPQIQ